VWFERLGGPATGRSTWIDFVHPLMMKCGV